MHFVDRDRLAAGVADDAPLARSPAEQGVARVLQAREPAAFGAHGAERLCGERSTGVDAAHHRSAGYARDLQGEGFLGLPRRDGARQVHKPAPLGELCQKPGLRTPQEGRELTGCGERVVDEVRRGRDVLRGLGDGELDAVAVGDRAALGGHGFGGQLLRARRPAERRALERSEVQGSRRREHQQREEGREDQTHPALDDRHAYPPGDPAALPPDVVTPAAGSAEALEGAAPAEAELEASPEEAAASTPGALGWEVPAPAEPEYVGACAAAAEDVCAVVSLSAVAGADADGVALSALTEGAAERSASAAREGSRRGSALTKRRA